WGDAEFAELLQCSRFRRFVGGGAGVVVHRDDQLVADDADAVNLFGLNTAYQLAEPDLTRVTVGRADADKNNGNDQRDKHVHQDASSSRVVHRSLRLAY